MSQEKTVAENLADAKAFAERVYEQSPLEFGWFADVDLLEEVIQAMIARGYIEGINASLRMKVVP